MGISYKYTNEDQYRRTTAAHASKQWIGADKLNDVYERVRGTRSGIGIYKMRGSDRTRTKSKYTLKCETHSTFAPYTFTNIEPAHHITKRIGRGEDPHFCSGCANPAQGAESDSTTSKPPMNYA